MGGIPNSDLPLIIAPGAIAAGKAQSATVERLFERNGWQGTWTYTVFDYWHFHLEGHEVLACVGGRARIGFGGEEKEGGLVVEMTPGDTVIVPAGVGHRRLEATGGFQVVGAYPPGQNGAISREGAIAIEVARRRIAALALPGSDPVGEERTGLLAAWN
ncbi:hypothetical protein DYI37_11910 [Fulvimarina endophytica]|uniref:Cupin domain-containing protein n=1 Tax=Fulvimarina endophytica TaxID=2293836 RepID=A0A371X3J1_9HYPH|nr:hypothetical protein DYI37_11910 [Fulvimarina endophytica]